MDTHPQKVFNLQRDGQLLPLHSFLPLNPGSVVSFKHLRLQPQSSFSSPTSPFCILHFSHCCLSSPGHPNLNPTHFLHLCVLCLQPKQEQSEVSVLLCSSVLYTNTRHAGMRAYKVRAREGRRSGSNHFPL